MVSWKPKITARWLSENGISLDKWREMSRKEKLRELKILQKQMRTKGKNSRVRRMGIR